MPPAPVPGFVSAGDALRKALASSVLLEAARAVVQRWDTPNWKDAEPTGRVIARLREAIEQMERAA